MEAALGAKWKVLDRMSAPVHTYLLEQVMDLGWARPSLMVATREVHVLK